MGPTLRPHGTADMERGVPWQTILVGMDLSRAAESALATAIGLARMSEGTVHVLLVVNAVMPPRVEDSLPGLKRLISEDAEQELKRVLSRLHVHGVKLQPVVRVGVPHEEITRAAEELGAQLIVIGKSRSSDRGPDWLGSTAEQVTRRARCSALVVAGVP